MLLRIVSTSIFALSIVVAIFSTSVASELVLSLPKKQSDETVLTATVPLPLPVTVEQPTSAVTLAVIGALTSVFSAAVTGFVALQIAKLNQKTKDAADKAELDRHEVKQTLQLTTATQAQQMVEQSVALTGIAKTGKDTHTLVNSNMGVQLELHAATAAAGFAMASELFRMDPTEDRRKVVMQCEHAAALASKLAAEHQVKQEGVDAAAAAAAAAAVSPQEAGAASLIAKS